MQFRYWVLNEKKTPVLTLFRKQTKRLRVITETLLSNSLIKSLILLQNKRERITKLCHNVKCCYYGKVRQGFINVYPYGIDFHSQSGVGKDVRNWLGTKQTAAGSLI